jgi:hypothetical protein
MKPHYVAKAIIRDGVHVGFRLYTRGGIFGALTFSRYFWTRS